jgi:hypothetical protein
MSVARHCLAEAMANRVIAARKSLVLIACAGACGSTCLRSKTSHWSASTNTKGAAARTKLKQRAHLRAKCQARAEKPKYIVAPEKQFGGAREAKVECAAGGGGRPARDAGGGFRRGARGFTRINSAQVFAPGKSLQRHVKRRLILASNSAGSRGPVPW